MAAELRRLTEPSALGPVAADPSRGPEPLSASYLIALTSPVGGAFIRQGRGKAYDPRALPKNLLPPGA